VVDFNTNSRLTQSALTLLVPWVSTNYTHNTVATNNFAVTADFLDRCLNSHGLSFENKVKSQPTKALTGIRCDYCFRRLHKKASALEFQ